MRYSRKLWYKNILISNEDLRKLENALNQILISDSAKEAVGNRVRLYKTIKFSDDFEISLDTRGERIDDISDLPELSSKKTEAITFSSLLKNPLFMTPRG
jgi:hypothetical protein